MLKKISKKVALRNKNAIHAKCPKCKTVYVRDKKDLDKEERCGVCENTVRLISFNK